MTTYVGQTGRTLQICQREHMQALTSADAQALVLAEHAMENHHSIVWDDAEVLDSSQRLH